MQLDEHMHRNILLARISIIPTESLCKLQVLERIRSNMAHHEGRSNAVAAERPKKQQQQEEQFSTIGSSREESMEPSGSAPLPPVCFKIPFQTIARNNYGKRRHSLQARCASIH
jgi:hypothetical protein